MCIRDRPIPTLSRSEEAKIRSSFTSKPFLTIKFLLTAKVTDGNGADDVKRVFFKSYDATREVWRTDLKGDQILFNLYDDGTGDSGSGALQSGDNTYSLNVFIIDTTAVGTYHWYFQAQDFSNAYSEELKKVIEIK